MNDVKTLIPILSGELVTLRPLSFSDVSVLAHYAGDKRVAENTTNIPHPYPPGAAENFIERALKPSHKTVWAIEARISGQTEFIGTLAASSSADGSVEFGFFVAPILWGKGYATDAVKTALTYLKSLGFHKALAYVIHGNDASARVLRKTGFLYIGDDEAYSAAQKRMVGRWRYELSFKG